MMNVVDIVEQRRELRYKIRQLWGQLIYHGIVAGVFTVVVGVISISMWLSDGSLIAALILLFPILAWVEAWPTIRDLRHARAFLKRHCNDSFEPFVWDKTKEIGDIRTQFYASIAQMFVWLLIGIYLSMFLRATDESLLLSAVLILTALSLSSSNRENYQKLKTALREASDSHP